MIWERKSHDNDRHTAEENVSLITMLQDPLLSNLQGATFAIEFLKLKRYLKEKLWALRKF